MKKFNLDKFLNALELDEELALADAISKERSTSGLAYRPCPRCGSRKWKVLNINEIGKAESCDKCEHSEQ